MVRPKHSASVPALRGYDAIWAVIRAQGTFAVPALVKACPGTSRSSARKYVCSLMAAGIVRKVAAAAHRSRPDTYELVPECNTPETPRVRPDGSVVLDGAMREAIWRSIKVLKAFTVAELVRIGSTEEVAITKTEAHRYLHFLALAGYVTIECQRVNLPRLYRILPSKCVGPLSPKVRRHVELFDPNLDRIVWSGEPEVVE